MKIKLKQKKLEEMKSVLVDQEKNLNIVVDLSD